MSDQLKAKTLYMEKDLAQVFQEWNCYRNFFYDINWAYFGDLSKATVVDFGCGDGSFLKECLAKGASFCLGLDISQMMVDIGSKAEKDKQAYTENLRFVIQDCFEPSHNDYGQFDFASCLFVLHSCGGEKELQIFFENVFRMLKPGGKAFIANAPMANTLKDQETIADLTGSLPPLKSDTNGKDPFFGHFPVYRPASSASESGKLYTRELMDTLSGYYWSSKKLMKNLEETGFVHVHLLRPSSGGATSIKATRLDALEEPWVLIAAEKPAQ